MKYATFCSGIEAPSVAWHGLGWQPVFFSEIEKFPCDLLRHHYPNTPNLGDMTKIDGTKYRGSVDVVCAGTPCQAFSVAGLRQGLKDPRGNLALHFVRLLDEIRPEWFVWENVPGVLSSNGGRDFGAFIGALGVIGYGWAYRVLDAQYFGVPQRRKRVFLVGHISGDPRRAAEVLFDGESVFGDTPQGGEKGEEIAGGFEKSPGGSYCQRVSPTLTSGGKAYGGQSQQSAENGELVILEYPIAFVGKASGKTRSMGEGQACPTIDTGSPQQVAIPPVSFPGRWIGRQPGWGGNGCNPTEVAPMLDATNVAGVAVFDEAQITSAQNRSNVAFGGQCPTVLSGSRLGIIDTAYSVRRFLPIEYERLQGFPDNYTKISDNTTRPTHRVTGHRATACPFL